MSKAVKLYTAKQLALAWKCSLSNVSSIVRHPEMEFMKLGKRKVYTEDQKAFAEANLIGPRIRQRLFPKKKSENTGQGLVDRVTKLEQELALYRSTLQELTAA